MVYSAKSMSKNSFIELCRFLACYCIFSYHTRGVFISGWIFVEFFFILSGFFTVKHIEHNKETIGQKKGYPLYYTLNKIRRIIPYSLIAMLLSFVIECKIYQLDLNEIVKFFFALVPNLLLIPCTGAVNRSITISENFMINYMIIPSLWYISALFVVLPIFIYMVIKINELIKSYVLTIVPFFLYGYLLINNGSINGWYDTGNSFFGLDMRALAGIMLGGAAYYAARYLAKIRLTLIGKWILSLVEIFIWISLAYVAMLQDFQYTAYVVIAISAGIVISFSGNSLSAKLKNSFIDYLGSLSLPIYCLHSTVITLFYYLYDGELIMTDAVRNKIFLLTLILAVIFKFLFRYLTNIIQVINKMVCCDNLHKGGFPDSDNRRK